MKKILSYIFLTAVLVLCFGGCGKEEKEVSGTSNMEETQGTGTADAQEGSGNAEDLLEDPVVFNSGTQDNSLDAYSAAVHMPLEIENPANALEGGGRSIWDELSVATAEGETDSDLNGKISCGVPGRQFQICP